MKLLRWGLLLFVLAPSLTFAQWDSGKANPVYLAKVARDSTGFEVVGSVVRLVNLTHKVAIGIASPGSKNLYVEGKFFVKDENTVGPSGFFQTPLVLGNDNLTLRGLSNGYVRLEPAGTGKSGTITPFTIDTDGTFADGDSTFNIQDGTASSMISAGQSTFTTSSARWLKENIRPFLSKVPSFKSLNTYSYNYIGTRTRTIGLMSDEWNALLNRPDNGKVNYSEVILLLIEKVKQIETQLDKIKAEN